jgi:hypothetical protein
MRTVKELIAILGEFPEDAQCYAYEGEAIGVGVKTTDGQYGFIPCSETKGPEGPVEPLTR